jgi:RimJ/RimL family protein N-acetyltransferase
MLVGDRVKIRPANQSDIDDLYNWWNDPDFAGEYAGFFPKTKREIKQLMKDAHNFIILTRPGSDKIGFVSYYPVRTDYLNLYEIGYRIRPNERGRGYTTEAAGLLVDYLFAKRKIERIESVTDVENLPSQRVLEKNGFKREGELKKRFYSDGEYRDEYMYGLLREDWQKARRARLRSQ